MSEVSVTRPYQRRLRFSREFKPGLPPNAWNPQPIHHVQERIAEADTVEMTGSAAALEYSITGFEKSGSI